MAVREPKLTYEDYLRFPDDGLHRELIDGQVHVTAAPSVRHQRLVLRIAFAIESHLRHVGGGEVFVAPFDVVLSDVDVVEPDVVYVSDADAGALTEANLRGAPTIAIEVLSDPRRDRRLKRDLYERAGVAEYWIVDPEADRVEVHRREGERYVKPEILEPGETLTTAHLPRLSIDVAELLRR